MYSRAQIDRGGNNVAPQGPGDAILDMTQAYAITTAGAGTLTAAAMLAGIVERTGPGAGYNETLDTADNLMAAAPQLTVGDSFEFTYRNTVAYAATLVAAEGAELDGSHTAVAASKVRRFLVTILSQGRKSVAPVTQTNGSAVISGLTQEQCKAIQPGMGVSGTGMPASGYVISVNSSTGSVTLSGNATTTASLNAVSFFPRYKIKGLSAADL